jgi:hypothetical protein
MKSSHVAGSRSLTTRIVMVETFRDRQFSKIVAGLAGRVNESIQAFSTPGMMFLVKQEPHYELP